MGIFNSKCYYFVKVELIKDFFFPKTCINCAKFGNYICCNCLKKIIFLEQQLCPVCGRAGADGQTHPACYQKNSLNGLISVLDYHQPIAKKLVEKIKYRFISDLINEAGHLMFNFLAKKKYLTFEAFLKEKPIIVPVPLHQKRQAWRGFNQSALIGKFFSQKLNLICIDDFLLRTRNTTPQVELKGRERKINIKGAFQINKIYWPIVNKRKSIKVFLVDDVWTTGSTIKECTKVLKSKGIEKVWALTLTR